ncbi:carboxypeptidase-like regulatory domain-containing protein [Solirubrobacter phytolaccae]|uniref:alpha-amylase n=1 Tax=Solirubrobacter phytolaccae TaxID=1404360 RepID=A0A9X3N613_9ACTN|nr:carboxypeptidase-like regulatory domain-containing protein [Solirubrobacter phytolaccae]MDA0180418.1 carboxypeptidase-like regulatory domain-containing protein [Solirubrobacter phytolaccae]
MRRLWFATLLAFALLVPSAKAYEVDLPITKMVLTYSDADECRFAVVFRFSPIQGAIGYRGKFQYSGGLTITPSGSSASTFSDHITVGDAVWDAPAGTHQFNGTVGGGGHPPEGCGDPTSFYMSAWQVLEAKAIFPDPVITSTVKLADGTPAAGVQVRLTGPSVQNRYTDSAGKVTFPNLPAGDYTVTGPGGFCVAGASGCATSRAVTLYRSDMTVDFVERSPHIVGQVLSASGGAPMPDVPVQVSGTSTDGDALSWSTRTGSAGRYDVPVRAGEWDVTFPHYACVRDVSPCTRTKHQRARASDSELTVDAVATAADLETIVEAPDTRIDLIAGEEKVVPVKVTVRNRGTITATTVRVLEGLQIGTKETPLYPLIPVKADGPPARTQLGAIPPGGEQSTTIPVRVSGDGEYELDAMAEAMLDDGRSLALPGRGTIKITGRFVAAEYTRGFVPTTGKGGLVAGGDHWRVDVKVANRSYARRVVLDPIDVALRGNALDGHVQLSDAAVPAIEAMDAASGSTYVQLEPRETKTLSVIVRTMRSDAWVDSAPGAVSGTQSRAVLKDPTGRLLNRDDSDGAALTTDDLAVSGDREYRVGVDDSAPEPPPFAYPIAYGAFSVGALQGLYNFTAGTLRGIFYELPVLAWKVAKQAPSMAWAYLRFQAELWNALRGDPAAQQELLATIHLQAQRAFDAAPALKARAGELLKNVNAAVLAHYERLWKSWYAGDYGAALQEFTAESTELGLAVAPGVLARFAKGRALMEGANAKLTAAVTKALNGCCTKVISYAKSLALLKSEVKPGFQLTNAHLRRMYGYTSEQVAFLKRYAKTNKLLIVARDRAAESVDWLTKRGAVLKHEAIKLKTVSHTDVEFLGYRKADIGRIVIKTRPPTAKFVRARLKAAGIEAGTPDHQAVLERYAARIKEYRKGEGAEGYVKWLRKKAGGVSTRGREIRLKWNLWDNAMDPTVGRNDWTLYRMRLSSEAKGEFQVVEFAYKGKWRSVTGDMDLLQITHADGRPLTDPERLKVYKDFASSVVGLMHPETATWVNKGSFSFAAKVNEFTRSATPPVQFAPDGEARAVRFIEAGSTFTSKSNYRVRWDGGYELRAPAG